VLFTHYLKIIAELLNAEARLNLSLDSVTNMIKSSQHFVEYLEWFLHVLEIVKIHWTKKKLLLHSTQTSIKLAQRLAAESKDAIQQFRNLDNKKLPITEYLQKLKKIVDKLQRLKWQLDLLKDEAPEVRDTLTQIDAELKNKATDAANDLSLKNSGLDNCRRYDSYELLHSVNSIVFKVKFGDEQCVLKRIPLRNERSIKQFTKEVAIMRSLHHPCIMRLRAAFRGMYKEYKMYFT